MKTLSCMFNMQTNRAYLTFLCLCLLLFVGIVLPYFYYRILKKVIETRTRVVGYNYFKKNQHRNFYRSTKGLFYSFLFFAFAFFPYFSLILIKDFQEIVPRFFYLYLFLFARSNSIFNPILYSLTNPLFKRGFKLLFSFLSCQKTIKRS